MTQMMTQLGQTMLQGICAVGDEVVAGRTAAERAESAALDAAARADNAGRHAAGAIEHGTGLVLEAQRETRMLFVQSHNQLTKDVLAAIEPISEELRMSNAALLGIADRLELQGGTIASMAELLGKIQGDTSLLRSAFVNKYAGCREAAGLPLSALLDSASAPGGERARGVVVRFMGDKPKVNALLIDATKPKQGALASTPDVCAAGVACYEGLRLLDQTAAVAVHSAIKERQLFILDRLQLP